MTLSALNIQLGIFPVKAQSETESSWTTLAPMPTTRGGFGLAVVNGKIYAIGGINENNVPLKTVEEYNPITNTWATRESMPTARSGFATAVYNNKIYVIGGTAGSGFSPNNEFYDPSTNTWSIGASMRTPRADLSANVVNDTIYLMGGKMYSAKTPFYIETGINECYYPGNDSWCNTKASLPISVMGAGSATVDNKIYVIGGSRLQSGATSLVNNNQVYDALNDTWLPSTTAKLSSVTSYGAAVATQGYLAPQAVYFVGGFTGSAFSNQAKRLNLSNDSWSTIESMPTSRGYLGLAVVGDVLYAIGGFDGTNWLGTNEQYKPVDYGTVAPKVVITSPENKTYREVSLGFVVNRGVAWIGYSLDGKANITISSGLVLSNLTQGKHSIMIYANDTDGNMGVSNVVYFSVDTLPPSIVIMAPGNQSYDTTDIQLTFTTDEAVTALEYSLDGQEAQDIIGNVTLVALSNGGHYVTVYATDDLGNSAQETVYFNIAPFPVLLLVAVIVIIIIAAAAGYILFKFRRTGSKKESE